MHVLVVSPGAADPALRGTLKAIAGLPWRVTAAVPHRWQPPGQSEAQLTTAGEDGGVRIVPVSVRPARRQGATGRWDIRALRRLLTDVRPDLVHIDAEPTTALAAALADKCKALGIPATLTTWESVPRAYALRPRHHRAKCLSRLAGVVAGTTLAADLLHAQYPTLGSAVIPDAAYDIPPTIEPQPEGPLALAFAGRLVPERGLDLLFLACVKLPYRWTITVMGMGPEQETLERLADRLGIASRITWRGGLPRSARREVWPRIDCIVVPSRRTSDWVETKTPILLEAMSHGVAPVVADTGSLPEVVGDAGLVVAEGDASLFTIALEHVAAPGVCAALGSAARQRVLQHYAPTTIAQRLADQWTRFVREHERGASSA